MNQRLKTSADTHPDVIIIGAGVFGLWAARHAIKRGERVLVLEKRSLGAGASGGFLGALMPHMPDNWNAKKQMQFEALASIGDAIGALEDDTGVSCGFRRCGRLMPLGHEKMLAHAHARIEGAKTNWQAKSDNYSMELIPAGLVGSIADGWLNEATAPFGATYDTLSARVNPRAYLKALESYILGDTRQLGSIRSGCAVTSVLPGQTAEEATQVQLEDGESLSCGRVVIANGWEAYDLLSSMKARVNTQLVTGRGVKGQAVLMAIDHDDNRPIIYDNGSYIVPQADNKIAVGSTSIKDWLPHGLSFDRTDGATEGVEGQVEADALWVQKRIEASITSFDHDDTNYLEHAMALCPPLQSAQIVERWANVRPRNTIADLQTGKIGSEPVFSALDNTPTVQLAVGGFKISLALAHVDRFPD